MTGISAPDNGRFRIYVENRENAFGNFVVSQDDLLRSLGTLADRVEISVNSAASPDLASLEAATFFIGSGFDPQRLKQHGRALRIVHCLSAGVEYYMPLDWLPPDAVLTNSSGAHEEKGGQYGLMAVLMLNERMPRLITSQKQRLWDQVFSSTIRGKTALFFGTGALGSAIAACLKPLGVRRIGISRTGRQVEEFDACHTVASLHDWLPKADFLIVATPLTPATRNAIGAREIALLPPHAGLVNIGRAPVVDYGALTTALREGRISGAVLDVFEQEPLSEESDLWEVPNLIITPHTSCDDHYNYIDRCLSIFAGNVDRFLKGMPLENVVDAAHQY